jgi:hypothetical protein
LACEFLDQSLVDGGHGSRGTTGECIDFRRAQRVREFGFMEDGFASSGAAHNVATARADIV